MKEKYLVTNNKLFSYLSIVSYLFLNSLISFAHGETSHEKALFYSALDYQKELKTNQEVKNYIELNRYANSLIELTQKYYKLIENHSFWFFHTRSNLLAHKIKKTYKALLTSDKSSKGLSDLNVSYKKWAGLHAIYKSYRGSIL